MSMRLLKIILIVIVSSVSLFAFDKSVVVKEENLSKTYLDKIENQVEQNNVQIAFLNKEVNSLKKIVKNLQLQNEFLNKNIQKLENTNLLYKEAIAKMILDISKIKKIDESIYIVSANVINVRACPSEKCPVVRKRLKGDLVVVEKAENNWVETKTGNFIYKPLLRKLF